MLQSNTSRTPARVLHVALCDGQWAVGESQLLAVMTAGSIKQYYLPGGLAFPRTVLLGLFEPMPGEMDHKQETVSILGVKERRQVMDASQMPESRTKVVN